VIFSADEGIAKPDPCIFHLTAARLGVSPEACVFIDVYAPNVASATDVGMVGIRFESAEQIGAALRQVLQW
jgi:HAD superfamily hydrolase (TIGR01509 family)